MGTELLTDKYGDALDGVLHCYDRVVLTGSLKPWSYAQGMTGYLYSQGIRIFDYVQFVQPLREQICANAEALAHANDLEIEYIRKKNFRKEDRIRAILDRRGEQPGMVHIFSALEPCFAYKPWHNIQTGADFLFFYAAHFKSVKINNSFYHLPKKEIIGYSGCWSELCLIFSQIEN